LAILSFASPFSSFSKESVTTKVSPIVDHGPFGDGGTVVGFSKYDGVRAAFEENFARRLELGSQLVVYEKGEKIIDLYGYAPEMETHAGVGYDGDTLQCVFSSGKNMEAIAMAMLVDRGLVDYDDLVTKHWPEFGANGKDTITVADVMRHSGGVPFVIDPESKDDTIVITPDDVFGVDPLEQKICAAERFPTSSSPELIYHAFTRGWLVNGILRRADPSGRSLGKFIKEEITDPLSKVSDTGEVTFFCGIPKEDQPNQKFANINSGSALYNTMTQIFPSLLGFGDKSIGEVVKLSLRNDIRRKVVSWIDIPPSFDYIDSPKGRSMEFPSAGMVANARSMAIINAAAMAGDGSFNGIRLMSPEGVSHSMGDIVTRIDVASDLSFGFSRGGYGKFKDFFGEGDSGSYQSRIFHPDDKIAYGNCMGWGGVGGSLSIVDREKDISFAYCMNAANTSLIGGVRTRRILLELQKAIAA
jgi:CubicO group peptidase (beta-lactamase class C family)